MILPSYIVKIIISIIKMKSCDEEELINSSLDPQDKANTAFIMNSTIKTKEECQDHSKLKTEKKKIRFIFILLVSLSQVSQYYS